jgi:hypothetical protein
MTTPAPITWTVHLAKRRPGRAVAVVLCILLGAMAVAALGGSPVLVALAIVLLTTAVAEFLLPVTYGLDAEGAHVRFLFAHRVLRWSRVRRVYLRPNGLTLSPLARSGWTEAYVGVTLRTRERDAVARDVRAWLASAGVEAEFDEDA